MLAAPTVVMSNKVEEGGLSSVVELLKELIGIPDYYTNSERNFSISLSVVAAVIGFLVLRRLIEQTRAKIITAAIVFVLSSLTYTWLFETGGVYFIQAASRMLILFSVTFLIPYED